MLNVGEPGTDLHDRRARSRSTDCDAHAVRRFAEGDRRPWQKRRSRFRPVRLWGLAYLADEPEALARDRADQPLLLAAIAERAARRVDTAGQGRFRDDTSVPDRVEQVILGHDVFALAHQIRDEVEDLRRDRDRRTRALQLPAIGVEHEVLEME